MDAIDQALWMQFVGLLEKSQRKQLRGQSMSNVILAVLLRYHVNLLKKDFY